MRHMRALSFFAAMSVGAGMLASPLPVRKSALVTIPATFTVEAPPAKVWETLTSVDGFGTLTGFHAIGVAKGFTKIGDAVSAQVWSDSGRLVVTELVPGKELRVTWEPGKGHYLCSKRIVLSPAGAGTSRRVLGPVHGRSAECGRDRAAGRGGTEKQIAAFRALAMK